MRKPNKTIKLHDLSADCPECGNKYWQIIVKKTSLKDLDDIKAIECDCGFIMEFDEAKEK